MALLPRRRLSLLRLLPLAFPSTVRAWDAPWVPLVTCALAVAFADAEAVAVAVPLSSANSRTHFSVFRALDAACAEPGDLLGSLLASSASPARIVSLGLEACRFLCRASLSLLRLHALPLFSRLVGPRVPFRLVVRWLLLLAASNAAFPLGIGRLLLLAPVLYSLPLRLEPLS